MATRVIVCGAAGRMGRRLIALADANPAITLGGAVETAGHAAIGADAGVVAGVGSLGVPITDDLGSIAERESVIIDFTAPAAALEHLRIAVRTRAAAVIGTTGLDPQQDAEARGLGSRTRTIISPNMSIGINVLLGAVRQVARALGDAFDVEIVELHHRHKKDAPSGTALALARAAADTLGRSLAQDAVFGREGQIGERGPREIGILAMRAGDATGDHTVLFGGLGERLELTHRSQSRDCFASGALRAAVWLAPRADGLYSIADVLGLTECAAAHSGAAAPGKDS